MNYTFEEAQQPVDPLRPVWRMAVARAVWRAVVFLARLPFVNVLGRKRREPALGAGTIMSRFWRAAFRRLMLAPMLIAVLVSLLVYLGTHPPATPGTLDPMLDGVYYDPIEFLSADGHTRLEGWLVPMLEPKNLVARKQRLLQERFPALVLVHDYGESRQQMLPLIRPLHEAGFVLLVVSLRGNTSTLPQSVTFGINESMDVQAAIDILRRRPFVDGHRVGIVAIGTGANAALLAKSHDPSVSAMVLDHPMHTFDMAVERYMSPRYEALRWIQPLCRWGFELSSGVDTDAISGSMALAGGDDTLLIDQDQTSCLNPKNRQRVLAFLRDRLPPPQPRAEPEAAEVSDEGAVAK